MSCKGFRWFGTLAVWSLTCASALAQTGIPGGGGQAPVDGTKTPSRPGDGTSGIPPYTPGDAGTVPTDLPTDPGQPPTGPSNGPPGNPPGDPGNDPPKDPPTLTTPGLDRWEHWWEMNRFSYLEPPKLVVTGDGATFEQEVLRLKSDELLPAFTRLVSHPNAAVRSAAALALGKLREPKAVGPVLLALRDDTPRVREAAILALGISGTSTAASVLFDIVADNPEGRAHLGREREHVFERSFAAIGLGLLDSRTALGDGFTHS